MDRIDKINYYLEIADTVLKRGTCLRRNYGAVIVKNDEIISTGYTGAPRGRTNCIDLGFCAREKLNIKSGEKYELCRSDRKSTRLNSSHKRSARMPSSA